MSRALVLGNGTILTCFDEKAQLRDLYYPYVGLENHTGGRFKHRIGFFADSKMRWFDTNWDVVVRTEEEAPVGSTLATNDELNLTVHLCDTVYNEKNVLIRKITVKNTAAHKRSVKLFIGHEFEIYESHRGDTAYFDPIQHTIIHYNGKRCFLINGLTSGTSFDDYTTGVFNIEGRAGSYKNAENGLLPKNAIEHGPTDSVIGFTLELDGDEEKVVYYWMTVGSSIEEVEKLDSYVREKKPEYMMHTTRDFWRAWVLRHQQSFGQLGTRIESLFKKSLFIVRAHTDEHGSILASGDSAMLLYGKDSYGYSWPRDGALCALALDLAGNTNIARRYFQFCNDTISRDGYFMHKYRPDASLGSSWHPWIIGNEVTLPIQEDETALVLHTLWNHYKLSKDLEFIEKIYNTLIKKAAEFMLSYRDEKTGLPKPSYDPWEEKRAIFTYTTATVVAGLTAASNFARILGKGESALSYGQAADDMRAAIFDHLYNEERGVFYKSIHYTHDNTINIDHTLDMSVLFSLTSLGAFDLEDPRIRRHAEQTIDALWCNTDIGGFARYQNDQYFRQKYADDIPGNPWIITTLWVARYYINTAHNQDDMDRAKELINWAVERTLPSGVLAEQFDPITGKTLSAQPLTWSHAEFITTVITYLNRLESLGLCNDCNPLN